MAMLNNQMFGAGGFRNFSTNIRSIETTLRTISVQTSPIHGFLFDGDTVMFETNRRDIYFHLLHMQLACFNLGYLFGPTRINRSFLFISRIWNQKPFEVCQECKAKHHSCRLGLVYIRETVVKLRWCSCVHVFQYPSWFMNQPGSLNPRFAGKNGGHSNQLSCKTHWFLYFSQTNQPMSINTTMIRSHIDVHYS